MARSPTSGRSFVEARPRYQHVKDIGEGAFGCVFLAKDVETGQLVAIKEMERDFVSKYAESEIINHSMLRHPHVVCFREVFLSKGHINIVMDYASGGSLLEYVQQRKRLRESAARWFFQQLILAVDYCHRKGVANRDIKLDNLLLQPLQGLPRPLLKVCDFGYSKQDDRASVISKVGTLDYMAPEVMHNGGGYDARQADIWSCGVVLFAMLTGRFPFVAPTQENGQSMVQGILLMLKKMKAQELDIPAWLALSPSCLHLLQRLLDPEPKTRITTTEVKEDPWFLAELPPNALSMNDHYLQLEPLTKQTPDEISAVVKAVRAGG